MHLIKPEISDHHSCQSGLAQNLSLGLVVLNLSLSKPQCVSVKEKLFTNDMVN